MMRTIRVIDGADDRAHDCVLADAGLFGRIHPGTGQDIGLIEDVLSREGGALDREFAAMWRRPVRRHDVRGIDGIPFHGLLQRKGFHPNRRDADLDGAGRASATGH